MGLPHALPSRLSPEEQQRRREIIDQGVAQVRLEGLEPLAIDWECAERYIQGKLTLGEMHTLLLQHFTRTP